MREKECVLVSKNYSKPSPKDEEKMESLQMHAPDFHLQETETGSWNWLFSKSGACDTVFPF